MVRQPGSPYKVRSEKKQTVWDQFLWPEFTKENVHRQGDGPSIHYEQTQNLGEQTTVKGKADAHHLQHIDGGHATHQGNYHPSLNTVNGCCFGCYLTQKMNTLCFNNIYIIRHNHDISVRHGPFTNL